MKKAILFVAATLLAGSALADSMEVQIRDDDQRDSDRSNSVYQVSYQHDYSKKIKLGGWLSASQRNTDDRITNRLQFGVTYQPSWWYVQQRLGAKMQSGTGTIGYFQTEVGMRLKVGADTGVKIGYRYRDSLDPTQDDELQGIVGDITHRLDRHNAVKLHLGVVENSAGQKTDRLGLAYIRNF
jgi:hypothetical protein